MEFAGGEFRDEAFLDEPAEVLEDADFFGGERCRWGRRKGRGFGLTRGARLAGLLGWWGGGFFCWRGG